MFREAPETDRDGNTVKGPVSARRVLAFALTAAAVALFVMAILFAPQYGWAVFIPGIACLAGALLLLFFTTWGDVAAIAAAWKGK
jgi:fatty acid desaturase